VINPSPGDEGLEIRLMVISGEVLPTEAINHAPVTLDERTKSLGVSDIQEREMTEVMTCKHRIVGPITSQNSRVCQNHAARVRRGGMSSTSGRALRSSCQHSSTVSHSSSLNPSCCATSGFLGRTPSMIAWSTRISDGISRKGWCPHKT